MHVCGDEDASMSMKLSSSCVKYSVSGKVLLQVWKKMCESLYVISQIRIQVCKSFCESVGMFCHVGC